MDLFNKKKLIEAEKEKDYYEKLCTAKNKTINDLQKDKSELNVTLNNLISENKKLLEWINKILQTFGTVDVHQPTVHIPIYKNNIEPVFLHNEGKYLTGGKIDTVVIPQIVISKFEQYPK